MPQRLSREPGIAQAFLENGPQRVAELVRVKPRNAQLLGEPGADMAVALALIDRW